MMSDRSNSANAGEAGAHVSRLGLCAGVLTLLVMAGVPAAARADAIVLTTGESIEGSIVDATRNTVIIRRAIGGMRQMRTRDIADVRIDLATGEAIAGEYLGWVDGVHRVRSGDEVVRISAGRILTRERWHEEVSTEPPGTPPARALPPAETPRPAAGPTVEPVAPAATVREPSPAEAKRAGAARAERPPAPNAPAQDAVAEGASTAATSTTGPPAAVAPVAVGRAHAAAAPAAAAAVVDDDAEVRAAAVAPAAAAKAEIAPAGAAPAVVAVVSQAAAAEVGTPEIAPAGGDTAAVTRVAAIAPAEVPPAQAGDGEADSDGRLPVVSASVEPAEPGADGVVFRIELSRPAAQTVVLIYGTVDGTAVAGQDYEPQQGVVTLLRGSMSTDVRVPLIGHRRSGEARFELFLTADSKVAQVVDRRISATIPAAD